MAKTKHEKTPKSPIPPSQMVVEPTIQLLKGEKQESYFYKDKSEK